MEVIGVGNGSSDVLQNMGSGCPSGFARQTLRSITEGWLLVIQAAWSRPGSPSASHLSQASQCVTRGVIEGRGK